MLAWIFVALGLPFLVAIDIYYIWKIRVMDYSKYF